MRFSEALLNARLDAIATYVGATPYLRLYSGDAPAELTDAATGTLLCEYHLDATWMDAAASGEASLADLPLSGTGAATGMPGYFRLYLSDGTTCAWQGTVGIAESGADLIVSVDTITSGGDCDVLSMTIIEGNA